MRVRVCVCVFVCMCERGERMKGNTSFERFILFQYNQNTFAFHKIEFQIFITY